jgi:hypothetical protein
VLILVDLATAELHSSNLAAACSFVTQAAELLQQTAYAVGTARLREFRTAAQRSLSAAALRTLLEQRSAVAGGRVWSQSQATELLDAAESASQAAAELAALAHRAVHRNR